MAWKVQDRPLSDLPYVQPLYPLLPLTTMTLAVLMFAAEGYSAVKSEPFNPRNVVATYLGVIFFMFLYLGYTIYERVFINPPYHIIPLAEVDLDTDAVWKKGEGEMVRQQDRDEDERRAREEATVHGLKNWVLRMRKMSKHIY